MRRRREACGESETWDFMEQEVFVIRGPQVGRAVQTLGQDYRGERSR